ncbi:MAG TPA: hypothetical protein VK648_05785 [Gemmatimonadaceae bacterium]|nr:hypothetical protein [Gemmatimonadaceae bacterium]
MNANPYQSTTRTEELSTERTVIIDPATGEVITIGARIERTMIDEASGQERRDVMNVVVPTADGKQLLFPYNEPLYACASCGAKPLVHAMQCAACGRFMCDACRIKTEAGIICRTCADKPWWAKAWEWLTNL